MEPKKRDEILKHIDEQLRVLNVMAMREYAQMLIRLKVKQPQVYNIVFMP